MAQWVKDLALSLQWLGSLLWCRFDSWPWDWGLPSATGMAKKKKKKERNGSCKHQTVPSVDT